MCKTCVVMQRGERTTGYAVVEAYNRKMQMQLQHLLQLLQLRFDLHFEDADPTPQLLETVQDLQTVSRPSL
jgi:hypothetical protein